MLARLFRRKFDDAHLHLYDRIVTQARQSIFYERFDVPDTVDGRFDMIVLHALLVMRRLQREGKEGRHHSQALFDAFFADMDRSLREMGVSDLGVPRRIKTMAQSFYGRVGAYEPALETGDVAVLAGALHRNLLAGQGSAYCAQALAAYAIDADAALGEASYQAVLGGDLPWPPVAARPAAETRA